MLVQIVTKIDSPLKNSHFFTAQFFLVFASIACMEQPKNSILVGQSRARTAIGIPLIIELKRLYNSACCAYWPKFTIEQLKNNPEALRVQLSNTANSTNLFKEFDTATNVDTVIKNFKETYEKICKKHPIFLLGECSSCCPLARRKNPHYRAIFEDTVSAALIKKIGEKNNATTYVGFGTGGMFLDFIIIAKALEQKPTANITVHLIDKQYYPYVRSLDLIEKSGTIGEKSIDLTTKWDTLLSEVREDATFKGQSDNQIKLSIGEAVLYYEAHFKQFKTGLQKLFPHATIALVAHYSAEDYFDTSRETEAPDIITAADIDDEMSMLAGAPTAYLTLCAQMLQKNPALKSFYLYKDNNNSACLAFLSNKAHPKSERVLKIEPPLFYTQKQL